MHIYSHINTAVRNITSAKLRAFLAMLSIMVGTASVVALVSAGQLAARKALSQFTGLGIDLMAVNFYSPGSTPKIAAINADILSKVTESIPGIKKIAPFQMTSAKFRFKSKAGNNNIVGSVPELAEIINIKMEQGRFLTQFDKKNPYCILGSGFNKKLSNLSTIGKRIQLGNMICIVIGVAEHWTENSFFPQDVNQAVIVPIDVLPEISSNSQPLSDAIMKLAPSTNPDNVKQAITDFLTKKQRGLQLYFQSAKELLRSMSVQQQTFTLLLGLIGGIALFVGGIGVMNVMLAAVSERKNEIGLRMALGAQPKDIQLMFIMESLVLALVGGGFGVLIGVFSTIFIAKLAGWEFTLFFTPPAIGLFVSLLISLFFGFYPAFKASKLNPIQALRL